MRTALKVLAVTAATCGLSSPALAVPAFLSFPVLGYNPFTNGIMSSVLDHEVPHDLSQTVPLGKPSTLGPYGYSGGVLSFTGELFLATSIYPNREYACYPKASNSRQPSAWSSVLQGVYFGTTNERVPSQRCGVRLALNYDNHPGYDYRIPAGTNVIPASGGSIISSRCIRTFANNSTCEQYGAVAIDHGNGIVTQYLHMRNVNYGTAARGINQTVDRRWTLGTVSNVGVPTAGPHLHFEVLMRKRNPVNTRDRYDRSNYIIVDPYGYNRRSYYASRLLATPGCLWTLSCRY